MTPLKWLKREPRALALVLRACLGLLLLAAGALKLRDPGAFATEIANYQLAPAAAPYFAATLPTVEILVGAGLLGFPGRWRRAAAGAALALFAGFAAAVGSAYYRHINIACGCFGSGGDVITGRTLLRNLALVLAAAALLATDRTPGARRTSA